MKSILESHFDKILEMSILVFIFIFATIMLAKYPMNEEMTRWIENGAIIAILARAFGTSPRPNSQVTDVDKIPPDETKGK